MPHSVHKNQLEIDDMPKHKTIKLTEKKKENPYDPSLGKDFLCTLEKAQALKKSMSLREKICNYKASFSPHHSTRRNHQ